MIATVSREPAPIAVIRHLPSALPAPSRSLSIRAAAGLVGASVALSAAAIEVVRAWTAPARFFSEASDALGGATVALFVLGGFALATRARELGGLAIASSFVLLAHGVLVVLHGQAIGGLFVALAPIVGLLTRVAFRAEPARHPAPRTTLDLPWTKAPSHQRTARDAVRAASLNRLGMCA